MPALWFAEINGGNLDLRSLQCSLNSRINNIEASYEFIY